MIYLMSGGSALVWTADGARFVQTTVPFTAAPRADPVAAVVPGSFVETLRKKFDRGDELELGHGNDGSLWIRKAHGAEALVQPLWTAEAHVEVYGRFTAQFESAGVVVVEGRQLEDALRDAERSALVELEVTSAQLLLDGTSIAAQSSLPEQRIAVDGAFLRDAASVADLKHPRLYLELLAGADHLRTYAASRGDQPEFGPLYAYIPTGAVTDPVLPLAKAPAAARLESPTQQVPTARRDEAPSTPGSDASASPEPFDSVLAEIDQIVGQEEVKKAVRTLVNTVRVNRERERQGLKASSGLQHMVFLGPPGTGKTTVARIIAKLYHALGMLENPDPVEVDRGSLMSSNIGGTEENMTAAIEEAQSGVLFLDEAYALVEKSTGNDFGKKALEVLLKAVEDQRDNFVCILAGYTDEMKSFMDTNPGLDSRFRRTVAFTPYAPQDLVQIAQRMASGGDNVLDEDGAANLLQRLREEERRGGFERKEWGNARSIRNIVDDAVMHRDSRVIESGAHDRDSLVTITAADINAACDDRGIGRARGKAETPEQVLAELHGIIGQPQLAQQIRTIMAQVRAQQHREAQGSTTGGVPPVEHLLFLGPPGTGKTTVARLIARLFRALGVLTRDDIVEAQYEDLVASYLGQTATKTAEKIDEAMGGVLFIDEAYRLVDTPGAGSKGFGIEAIEALVPRLENDRGKFLAVAAGYPDEMERFLDSNVGLRSRFRTRIELRAYTADDLVAIALSMAAKEGQHLTEAALAAMTARLEGAEKAGQFAAPDWGNARSVRNLLERAMSLRDLRLFGDGEAPTDPDALSTIEEADVVAAAIAEGIAADPDTEAESVEDVLTELDQQVGQPHLKAQVRALVAQVQMAQERQNIEEGGTVPLEHLLFVGPPGTGKTTIARLIARLYKALGLLQGGTIIEAAYEDLVGQHLGQTAPKTAGKVDDALGGILFLDEVYRLVDSGTSNGKGFGAEAIDALVPRLEDDRGKFVAIAAGYPDDVQRFLDSNVGLTSRFTTRIEFQPYDVHELVEIAVSMASRTKQAVVPEARDALTARLSAAHDAGSFARKDWGNAREVRNLVEGAMKQRDLRIARLDSRSAEDLLRITAADIDAACGARGLPPALAATYDGGQVEHE
jgi:SpoVK/Ycf46/Vps4 family AAA+-type ATPase